MGKFDEAFKLYNAVLKSSPGYIYGFSNRANVQIARGELQSAISDYDRAIKLSEKDPSIKIPDLWLMHLNRGTTYMVLGDEEKSMEDMNLAVSLNKRKDFLTLINRGQLLERLGRWEEALNDYSTAINLNSSSVQPWWVRYALVLYQQDSVNDALSIAKRTAAKFGIEPEPLATLTTILYGKGDTTEALKTW
eukprot:CAMPEP_0171452604 /NCGR_PEP_ID=MMETSP0945-20130129/645_1 /TAXON_ID=109269 /ORGANISM="Vaucheria litorea, Strain CCMP2940" /LENGTH=191 /DNA_ID=CAMNT_0011977303 /DNA_START=324 /DNA_END=896 /DNA_ORIENTATION=+